MPDETPDWGRYLKSLPKAAIYTMEGEVDNISRLPRRPPVYTAKSAILEKSANRVSDYEAFHHRVSAFVATITHEENEKQFNLNYNDYKLQAQNQRQAENTIVTQVPEGKRIDVLSYAGGIRGGLPAIRKRKSPGEKQYRYSLSYNKCCGYYSPCFEGARFCGSSLNRKYAKQKKGSEEAELSARAGALAKVEGKEVSWDVATWEQYRREVFEARICIEASRRGYKDTAELESGLSCSVCGQLLSDCMCGGAIPELYHTISPRSRSKIRDKATAFFRASFTRRTFVTLSFIDKISDSKAMQVLNSFFTQLRKKFGDLQYIWVAERQLKNKKNPGNIHFHVIVNRRLKVAKYNPLWVLQQYNAGLVGHRERDGSVISKREIQQRYREGTVGKVLNPFDIKEVKSIQALSRYITKYITKGCDTYQGQKGFRCAAWHCTRGVSRMFTRETVGPGCFSAACSAKNMHLDFSTGECTIPGAIRGDFWIMVYINVKDFAAKRLSEMERINRLSLQGYYYRDWRELPMIDDNDYRRYYLSEN